MVFKEEMEKKWQVFAVLKKRSLPARRQEIINHILRRRGIEDREAFFNPPSPLGLDLTAAGISRKEVEKAKKIIKDNNIAVTEIWSYETEYPKVKTIKFKKEELP